MQRTKNNYRSSIVALSYVSESEIIELFKDYDSSWESTRPTLLKRILFQYGLDTTQAYERQDGLLHRNRMNKVQVCSRWVGQERLDEEWIKSGLASQEAKDKVQNSKLLDDLYRMKNATQEMQEALEARDRYYVEPEENE